MELPQVLVINLKGSVDRRDHIAGQLRTLGCHFQFVEAVNGKQMIAEQLQQYSSEEALRNLVKGTYRELSSGEIGCVMSHLEIYRKMIDEDIQEAVILEDDALVKPGFVEVLKRRRMFPEDWMVVYLGHKSDYLFSRGAATSFRARRKICKGYSVASFVEYPWDGFAYLINNRAAKLLLDFAHPIRMPADLLLTGNYGELPVSLYGIKPPCVIREKRFQSETTIGEGGDIWNCVQAISLRGKALIFLNAHPRLLLWLRNRPKVLNGLKYMVLLLLTLRMAPSILLRQLGIVKSMYRAY